MGMYFKSNSESLRGVAVFTVGFAYGSSLYSEKM